MYVQPFLILSEDGFLKKRNPELHNKRARGCYCQETVKQMSSHRSRLG
jgi:hypothetical protein